MWVTVYNTRWRDGTVDKKILFDVILRLRKYWTSSTSNNMDMYNSQSHTHTQLTNPLDPSRCRVSSHPRIRIRRQITSSLGMSLSQLTHTEKMHTYTKRSCSICTSVYTLYIYWLLSEIGKHPRPIRWAKPIEIYYIMYLLIYHFVLTYYSLSQSLLTSSKSPI